MKTIEPNSLEAVVLFILYICAQDGNISDEELEAGLNRIGKALKNLHAVELSSATQK